ncbi:MAG: hypothetical protein ACK43N_23640, partial [Pirellulaceae bacterium]
MRLANDSSQQNSPRKTETPNRIPFTRLTPNSQHPSMMMDGTADKQRRQEGENVSLKEGNKQFQ